MGHGHHQHVDPEAGDLRVFAAIAVNLGLTVAQVVGGIVSGSLTLEMECSRHACNDPSEFGGRGHRGEPGK